MLADFGISQTWPCTEYVFFRKYFGAFYGPCVRGRGRSWYGTSARPESQFIGFLPRCACRMVPSTYLLTYFWGILRGPGEGRGGAPDTVPLPKPQVTSRKACLRNWGNPKKHMQLQQPRNYDFGMFQFDLLGSQGGNSREMTTSPPGHH